MRADLSRRVAAIERVLLLLGFSDGCRWFLRCRGASDGFSRVRRFHPYRPHHPAVFMLQQMAVVHERPQGIRIAEIHAYLDAGILQGSAVVEWHVDRVA